MKSIYCSIYLLLLLFTQAALGQKHILWYNNPASYFEESLIMGNGKTGASIFGGVYTDSIYLNDATLWSGEPINANMNPQAQEYIPLIREALQNENYPLADELQKRVQGAYSQSFSPLGTLYIDFQHDGTPTKYYRELDIENAISKVKYTLNGIQYTREYFVSHPAKTMAIKLSCSKKGSLNFHLRIKSLLQHVLSSDSNLLRMQGYAPIHAEPIYRGNIPNAIVYESNKGTRFTVIAGIKSDGKVEQNHNSISLKNGTEAIIYITTATSFNGFDKNPATEGLNNNLIAEKQLKNSFGKSYISLKTEHINDYKYYFERVKLSLDKQAPNIPTDERLKRYSHGESDQALEILYFQYGRYLLISSSRTLGVPANLQGIWNPHLQPPWSSNYTMNINLEENYWLAETANLSEMHEPLLQFIQHLSKTGATTAKNFYGIDSGWTACHNSDIWAMSNPVGGFGEGDPVWANWNMGGTWLCTHLWEHYSFTRDIDFLRNTAYPLMKGAAQFCLAWMTKDRNGYFITSPSTSPENKFLTPSGYQGATLYGGTADLAMIRELFIQTIQATKILQEDTMFGEKLTTTLSQLLPYQIGEKGNLQEWYYDWQDPEPLHRHQSHLFGLYPGHHISPLTTPKIADACRKTLEIKGDETTGWSKGWRINLWARLRDGNRAYKMYRELLRYVEPDGKNKNSPQGGGTYPNLLDAHPPFQIDGNFGGAAAVIEMLLQSTHDTIYLLPAIPETWSKGMVNGLCARGGYEVSMSWNNNTLRKVSILSKKGGTTTLIHKNTSLIITLKKGELLTINWK